jgi:hypothetical protein
MISNSKDHFFTGRGLSNVFRTEDEWKAAQREATRKELVRAEKENQRKIAEWCAVAWRNNLNG